MIDIESGGTSKRRQKTIRGSLVIGTLLFLLSSAMSLLILQLMSKSTNISQNINQFLVVDTVNFALAVSASILFTISGIFAFKERKNDPFNLSKWTAFGSAMLALALIPFFLSFLFPFTIFFLIKGTLASGIVIDSILGIISDFLGILFISVGLFLVSRAIIGSPGKILLYTGFTILVVFGGLNLFESIYTLIQLEQQATLLINTALTIVPDYQLTTPILRIIGLLLILLSLLIRRPIRTSSTPAEQSYGSDSGFTPDEIVVEREQTKREKF